MLNELDKPNGKTTIQDAVNMVGRAARTKLDLDDWRNRAEHLYDDTLDNARRMAKKGRYAAEDLIDETEYKIKREPFRAVGVTFGIGIGIGLFAGWMFGRMIHHCDEKTEH